MTLFATYGPASDRIDFWTDRPSTYKGVTFHETGTAKRLFSLPWGVFGLELKFGECRKVHMQIEEPK